MPSWEVLRPVLIPGHAVRVEIQLHALQWSPVEFIRYLSASDAYAAWGDLGAVVGSAACYNGAAIAGVLRLDPPLPGGTKFYVDLCTATAATFRL